MVSKAPPYFRWYPADAETDEWYQGLTDAHLGYYWRLMNHFWNNGSIPADHKRRCQVFRVHPKFEQAAFKEVSRMFQEDVKDASRLVHGPLQEQLKEIASKSIKASESVKHRYERTTSDLTVVGRHARARAVSVSVSSEEVDFKKEGPVFARPPTARDAVNASQFFRPWWERWCEVTHRQVGELDAKEAWAAVVIPGTEASALECLESYLASGEVAAGKVRNPAKFLYEEGRNGWRSRWPSNETKPPAAAPVPVPKTKPWRPDPWNAPDANLDDWHFTEEQKADIRRKRESA